MKHTDCTHPATPAGRAACRSGKVTAYSLGIEVKDSDEKRLARKAGLKVDVDYSTASLRFESETCGRCGGSGTYPSACWNGVCLGCSGSGSRFTRNGAAAYKRYRAWLDENSRKAARDVTPLDRIDRAGRWVRVYESREAERPQVSTCTVGAGDNAVTTQHVSDWILVTRDTRGDIHNYMPGDTQVIVRPSGDARNAMFAAVAHLKGSLITRPEPKA